MEYLLEGLRFTNNTRKCQEFIQENNQIIEDVMLMNKPEIKPVSLNIRKSEKDDMDDILLKWRYFCFGNPDVKLVVVDKLDKKDEKNCLHRFTKKISNHALEYIKLQINFSQLPFNDFIQYLFDNAEKYKSVSLDPYKERLLDKEIEVCVMKNIEGKYDFLYLSKDFYDLVEGSKIFLHWNNYQFFEEQLSFCYGNEMEASIKTFFRIKFLKFFMYKNLNLIAEEYLLMGGSFYLFSMGLRPSRDIDIYSVTMQNIKTLKRNNLKCKFDIQEVTGMEKKLLNPHKYAIYFGFKGEIKEGEIEKRKFRYEAGKSHKALADLIILNYYFGKKNDMKINNSIKKMLQFRYKKFQKYL